MSYNKINYKKKFGFIPIKFKIIPNIKNYLIVLPTFLF